MKEEIFAKYGVAAEDRILCAHTLDLCASAENKNYITHTGFLSMHEQSVMRSLSPEFSARYEFFGGYAGAERCVLYFLPEYADSADGLEMRLITAGFSEREKLTHRDFLGALMSLGITRANVGDISVCEGKAQIFVLDAVCGFICQNFTRVKNTSVSCKNSEISEFTEPVRRVETVRDTVMSPRLDAVISSAFSVSRSDAQTFIEGGYVFVNDIETRKCSKTAAEGDKLVLRGRGRARLKEISEKSKKGRTWIEIERFL